MQTRARLILVATILLSGLALIPFASLPAQAFGWQQYAGTYQDVVTIQAAQYRTATQQLTVQATSTDPTAVLTVQVTSTGELIGTLRAIGGGAYRGRFAWPANPGQITVQSSLGGSATVTVRAR